MNPILTNRLASREEQFPRDRFHESRNLDLLRSAAVLFVYIGHLISFFSVNKSGFFALLARAGVLIFFVHTSLVLMLSMERMHVGGLTLFRNFIIRRAFRIYPLSVCCVLCVIAFRIPFMPLETYQWPGWGRVVSNLLLIQNVTGVKSVMGPLWSLPWEVQMYLVLPFLFLAWRHRPWKTLITVWSGTCAAVCIGALLGSRVTHVLIYFPCFLGGMLALTLAREKIHLRIPAYLWPVMICVECSVFAYFNHLAWARKVIYPEWILCGALGLFIPLFKEISSTGVVAKAAAQIAKYSYGIYLVHVPALWLSLIVLRNISLAWRLVCLTILTVSLPVLVYHLIENPLIQVGKRLTHFREPARTFSFLRIQPSAAGSSDTSAR
jgi:peptidoglycan/LPS O-acetylase OafA/YrhL